MEQNVQNAGNQSVDLLLLQKEVETLKSAMQGERTPWYRNISTVLSVIAMLFSFGTTFVSYKRTESQDIQNARVELRGLLQRLSALPRENIEMTRKYENTDPSVVASIGSFINQENTLLARQASEIDHKLPPQYVSATEYYAIGVALQNAYDVIGAKELFTTAIDVSTNLNDRVGALRSRANLLFITGQPDAGRVDYQRALNVFSDFSNASYNEYTKKSTHIWTELAWAYSEASIGSRDAAFQHVQNAEHHLSGLPDGPGVQQLKNQISQAKNILLNVNGQQR